MKTKTIPFDLETAKKIQAGEIKGKILNNLKDEVRIVCFDREDAVAPIIALFKVDGGEGVMYVRNDGHAVNCRDILTLEVHYTDVVEEVYTGNICFLKHTESTEPKFKPFDKVLVRNPQDYTNTIGNVWTPALFQIKLKDDSYFNRENYLASGIIWSECIPYEGNEHLVGTTVNPIPKEE